MDKHINLEENDMQNLLLSLISLCVILFFLIKITKNFITMWKRYFDEGARLHSSDKDNKYDNNEYSRDEIEFKNNSNQILQNIKLIKRSNNNEFRDLTNYKQKYNLDHKLNAEVNNKILSKEFDDYTYESPPNIIHFILDVFKPTKV